MAAGSYAKTANRSVVGTVNDFAFLADVHCAQGDADDLVALSVGLAGTPCGPLRKGRGFPDCEVEVLWPSGMGIDRCKRTPQNLPSMSVDFIYGVAEYAASRTALD